MALAKMRRFGVGMGSMGSTSTSTVQSQIVAAANQYGVDPSLALAVAQQESGFQQTGSNGSTLSSSAGALGVMQLMPATAAGLGVNPNDQTQNINGGVALLAQLNTQFNGNVPEVLAAYNAGPSAVINAGGVPNIPETQNYVSSIMANLGLSSSSSSSSSPSSTSNDSDGSNYLSSVSNAVAGFIPAGIDITDPSTLFALAVGAIVLYVVLKR